MKTAYLTIPAGDSLPAWVASVLDVYDGNSEDGVALSEFIAENFLADWRSDEHVSGGNLPAALSAAILDAGAVAKDRTHGQGYGYASTEALIREARGSLAKYGLSLLPTSSRLRKPDTEPGSTGSESAVLVREFDLLHSSGEVRPVSLEWPVVRKVSAKYTKPADKAAAGAATSALGYMLRDLLLLPRVEPGDDLNDEEEGSPVEVRNVPTITSSGLDRLEKALRSERAAEKRKADKEGDEGADARASRAARQAKQHESWNEGERVDFCDALRKQYGVSYDRVAAFATWVLGKDSPSNWPSKWRSQFFERIGDGTYPAIYDPSGGM